MFSKTIGGFVLVLLFAGCSDSTKNILGGFGFRPSRLAPFATAPDQAVAIGEDWLVYLAVETAAGGTDLNGDGDSLDLVAIAFDLQRGQATPLRASTASFVLGDEVWIVTPEDPDGRDWDADGDMDDVVLLHWSKAAIDVGFVARLDGGPVTSGQRLYFTDGGPVPPPAGDTRLKWVDAAAPISPVSVPAAGQEVAESPRPIASDADMLFLHQDETREGRDLNGDGDSLDASVLALLDGGDPGAPVRSVGLCHAIDTPVRAHPVDGEGWLVAFLVDEAGEGTNLNDEARSAAGLPLTCAATFDSDLDDAVLHCLFHASWSADPALFPPLDTAIAGDGRVFAMESADGARFVAGTLAPETDEGACSLNGDADLDDRVLRWIEVTPDSTVVAPAPTRLVALGDTAGGARGAVQLQGRFVATLSESADSQDLNGDPLVDVNALGFIDPFESRGEPADWTLRIFSRDVYWMGPRHEGEALLVGVRERQDLNCNGDVDLDDAYALFGRFDDMGLFLEGKCLATERFNVGQVQVDDVGFWRGDERDQNRDLNEDGDLDDFVLMGHTVFPLGMIWNLGTLNGLQLPSVSHGAGDHVAFLEEEGLTGRDLNGDGDSTDYLLRILDRRTVVASVEQ